MTVEIRKVGVIGAGQMGNGIAHVIALAGYPVAINDLKKDAVEKAIGIIQRNMTRQVSRGLIRLGRGRAMARAE